jgi:hypothetical protein
MALLAIVWMVGDRNPAAIEAARLLTVVFLILAIITFVIGVLADKTKGRWP